MEFTEPVENNITPIVPSGLTVDGAFDGMVGISWDPDTESSISRYNIYRSFEPDLNFTLIGFTLNSYYEDIWLEYDSTYYYKVSAVNKAGLESNLTNAVFAKPKNLYPPIVPSTLNINARNREDSLEVFLSWNPSIDKDIAFYEIYRDTIQFLEPGAERHIGFTDKTNFTDKNDLKIGTTYFYRIRAYDKGDLKSSLSQIVSDYVLDKPKLISPLDKAEITKLTEFRIKTVIGEAKYKLIVQSSSVGGIVKEINFFVEEPGKEKLIDVSSLLLEAYKTYFWRVMTFTNNNTEPNSYSNLYTFYYNPK